jgi:hypothetical protein
VNKKKVVRKNKASADRVTTGTAFYIFFGIVYLGFIWLLHLFAPFYHKSNDLWNDRTFSQPLQGELFPDNIILIDIDPWPYYKDNREEANQARDKVVTEMIRIIDLLNKNPRAKPPFIGIDMTFESFANEKIMDQLFTRIKNNKNIYQAVEFDTKKKELKYPGNYFWNRIKENLGKIKNRFMVINLEKYADEPIRRYKTFYNAAFDDTGATYNFPSMGTLIAKMVKKYYLGDSSTFEVPDRVSRFRFRYLIQNIKEDFQTYNVHSLQFASGGQGLLLLIPCETLFFRQTFEMTPTKERHLSDREWVGVADPFLKKPSLDPAKTFNSPSGDFSKCIVIFGRVDPDPGGRDRFPVCAIIKKDNIEREATLPGVMIHINAAQSILLGEDIRGMATWQVLVYLIILLLVLILLHIVVEAGVDRWKPGWSHWYAEIFLFFAFGFFVIFLDNILKEPGNYSLEIPMFTFYMFVVKFYPALGVYEWVYRRVVPREKKKSLKHSKEGSKNAK